MLVKGATVVEKRLFKWLLRCLAWRRCCRLKSTHCFLIFFSPMDLAKGKSSRVALSAAFAILTSRLMRLLLHGDIYWDFPGMEDPEYAEKMSFLRSMWNKTDSRPLSLRMYSRLCFIMQCCDYVVISSRWIHMIALHTLHGYVTDTGTIILLPQRLWSKPGVNQLETSHNTQYSVKCVHIYIYIYIYIYISASVPLIVVVGCVRVMGWGAVYCHNFILIWPNG